VFTHFNFEFLYCFFSLQRLFTNVIHFFEQILQQSSAKLKFHSIHLNIAPHALCFMLYAFFYEKNRRKTKPKPSLIKYLPVHPHALPLFEVGWGNLL
jgi:hypothetical protein